MLSKDLGDIFRSHFLNEAFKEFRETASGVISGVRLFEGCRETISGVISRDIRGMSEISSRVLSRCRLSRDLGDSCWSNFLSQTFARFRRPFWQREGPTRHERCREGLRRSPSRYEVPRYLRHTQRQASQGGWRHQQALCDWEVESHAEAIGSKYEIQDSPD